MPMHDYGHNHDEAVRQLTVCNSCRYCEGYCNAFKALTRYRRFDKPTVSHLANLCHDCRGCYYACQYTEPHEFAINIPALLADIRAQNWEQHIKPSGLSKLLQAKLWPYLLMTVVFMVLFSMGAGASWMSSEPFYTTLSHSTLVALFFPLFVLPWFALFIGIRSYWKSVGGSRVAMSDIRNAFASAATMKNLTGGQGQGCNYEAAERYTHLRRWAHHATMYGFLMCFASTSLATIYHYVFSLPAPYALFSLPKILGVVGGMLLSCGTATLAVLKWKADTKLGSVNRSSGEYAFVGLLFSVSTTGLLLYWASGTGFAAGWLIIHLSLIATFFISIPYSKMVHGLFRLAALCREAQIRRLASAG